MTQFMTQGQSHFRLSFVARGLPDVESRIYHDMHNVLDSIRQQLLFMVYANDIRQLQAQCWSGMKKLFIHYAVDVSGRRNQLLAVDVSKASIVDQPFAEPFFDFLDHGNIITNHERSKATNRLRILFELFKITLNARDAENMIFGRHQSKAQYKKTLVRLVSQREAENRSKGQNFPYRFSEDMFACEFCDYKCRFLKDFQEHCDLVHSDADFACDKCDFKANTFAGLAVHNKKRHIGKGDIVCVSCEKRKVTQGFKSSIFPFSSSNILTRLPVFGKTF